MRRGVTPLLPLVGAAVAVATIVTCTSLAHAYGHLPLWFEAPQISLTGIHQPERTAYAAGFSASALALYAAGRAIGGAIEAAVLRGSSRERDALLVTLRHASTAAAVAAAGLALQGIVPLASVGCDRALWAPVAEPPHCAAPLELLARAIHAAVGANAFFLGTFVHGYLMVQALASPAAPAELRASVSRAVKAAALGLALAGCALVPAAADGALGDGARRWLLGPLVAPAGASAGELSVSPADEARLEAGGFGQRWAVAWLIVYWASFALDARVLGL